MDGALSAGQRQPRSPDELGLQQLMPIPSLLGLFFLSAPIVAELPTNADATAILRDVVATYEAMSSYRDQGRSILTLGVQRDAGNTSRSLIEFRTLFDRHGRYVFAWTSSEDFSGENTESSSNCFWFDGSKGWYAERNYGGRRRKSEMNLRDASAATTGISQGTSHEVFRLLTDEVGGLRYDQLKNLRITGKETTHGVDSDIVRGDYSDGSSTDLWIGRQDHLIRKRLDTALDGATTLVERTNIVVNSNIPATDFSGCENTRDNGVAP